MRPSPLGPKCAVFAGVLASMTVAAPAFAGDHFAKVPLSRAGIACRSQRESVESYWSNLLNVDSIAHTVWCPLDSLFGGEAPLSVSVAVSPGWATTSSCTIAEYFASNTGWFYSVNSITHMAPANVDVIGFTLRGDAGIFGAEVECSLPPQSFILGYSESLDVIFHATDW